VPNRLRLGIVTPASRASNNGNWQTAWRWSRLLAEAGDTRILTEWNGEPFDALIALHARRSAASILAWHAARRGPLAVVLTGTDLYRDLDVDASARAALACADRIVVLQDLAPDRLAAPLHERCIVCFQSCARRAPVAKTSRHLRALMVGHLREEKSPQTYLEAARLLRDRADIRLDHVGAPLDQRLADEARATAQATQTYRWLGARDHATTRRLIQQAHVLVHASRMEGGAHVVAEAVRSGTPVIASRIDGNVGMLGADYAGYFAWDDAPALASLIARARDEAAMLPALARQCEARTPLFDPARERATLRRLLEELLPRAHAGSAPRRSPSLEPAA